MEVDWQPSTRHLRQFSACLVVLLVVVAWYTGDPWRAAAIMTAVVIAGLGWFQPSWLKPVYLTAVIAAFPIGLVIGELALLTIYVTVFVPIALIFRIMKRDALQRTIHRDGDSYWQACQVEPSQKTYLRRY